MTKWEQVVEMTDKSQELGGKQNEIAREKNLIGVNSEKEPLTGISPSSRLFERSLHHIM